MEQENQGGNSFDRPRPPMVQGNWKCAECGKEITELPFQPRADSDVYCYDCYKNRPRRDFRS